MEALVSGCHIKWYGDSLTKKGLYKLVDVIEQVADLRSHVIVHLQLMLWHTG